MAPGSSKAWASIRSFGTNEVDSACYFLNIILVSSSTWETFRPLSICSLRYRKNDTTSRWKVSAMLGMSKITWFCLCPLIGSCRSYWNYGIFLNNDQSAYFSVKIYIFDISLYTSLPIKFLLTGKALWIFSLVPSQLFSLLKHVLRFRLHRRNLFCEVWEGQKPDKRHWSLLASLPERDVQVYRLSWIHFSGVANADRLQR